MCNFNKSAIAAACLFAANASAVEFHFNGFASVAAGKAISQETLVDGSKSTYVINPAFALNPDGTINEDAGYDDSISFKPDTNVGLQMRADIGTAFLSQPS